MDPGPDNRPDADTSTSHEDALIANARRQAMAATPLSGSGSTLPHAYSNGAAGFVADAMPGYEPVGTAHRGGQGVVQEAIQRSTRRRVAIKILREGQLASNEERARFEREVLALAQLKHPNIVTIYDSGVAEGRHYFVMDFINGLPLDEYCVQVRAGVADILQLFVKICSAVNIAHDRGIVHRDLKPSNIRISPDGEPHILDFGLAKLVEPTLESTFSDGGEDALHTVTGQFVGTPPWTSPEQARAHHDEIDIRSDVYSLGVILYQLLTRTFPYDIGGGRHAVLDRVINSDPIPPRRHAPELDGELETIVLKCLDKEPVRRYDSAGELGEDLSRYLAGKPIEAKRDSSIYLVRKYYRNSVRKNPAASYAAVILLSVAFVRFLGVPLVFQPDGPNAWFERRALAALPTIPSGEVLENVRVIGLPSPTDIPKLASEFYLPKVTPDDTKSWRQLHGLLMARLKSVKSKGVFWDVGFYEERPSDEDFVNGVKALNSVGIPVVITRKTWGEPTAKKDTVSSAIATKVSIGCSRAGFTAKAAWYIYLVRQRGLTNPEPSAAIAAFAAIRHPGTKASYVLDVIKERVSILYKSAGPGDQWLPESNVVENQLPGPDVITLSSVKPVDKDGSEFDLLRDDVVGRYIINMPSDTVLDHSTVDYGDVLHASDLQLRDWFENRLIAIGYVKAEDRFHHPDGRIIPGVYGHAVAIDALMRGVSFRRPKPDERMAIYFVASAVGLGVSFAARRRVWLRLVILILLSGLFWSLGVWACTEHKYLCNPFVIIIAMIVGCELAAMIHRLRRASSR